MDAEMLHQYIETGQPVRAPNAEQIQHMLQQMGEEGQDGRKMNHMREMFRVKPELSQQEMEMQYQVQQESQMDDQYDESDENEEQLRREFEQQQRLQMHRPHMQEHHGHSQPQHLPPQPPPPRPPPPPQHAPPAQYGHHAPPMHHGYGKGKGHKGHEQNLNPLTGSPYTPRFYYLLEKRQRLPAWAARQEFLRLMQSNQVLVLVGEPGSGKTTQLPQILLDAGYHVQGGQVRALCCVQPSQLATTSAATRICEELECQVGTFVGHVTRFEDRSCPDTLLRFMTDEALFREAMEDPLLERYSVIVLDEVQQRTCEMDVLLGILKMVMQRRPELKLLLLSSTEEVKKVQIHFEAPMLKLPHKTYQVEVLHMEDCERDYLKAAVRSTLQIHSSEAEGDILVFLPREEEIELCCQMLRKQAMHLSNGHLEVRPLYVGLPLMDIQRVFETIPSRMGGKPSRKAVIATQVAETSQCIDHIAYVVDSGLVKLRVYNPRTRVDSHVVTPISKASAAQRARLAARSKPGKCFRLYPEKAQNEWPQSIQPEMKRSNLTSVVLMLKRLGFDDVVRFDFVEPPAPEALMRALQSLNCLGCLDDHGHITELGHQASRLPLEVQVAKMLIEAPRHRCSNEALSIAAMLCAPEVWLRQQEAFKAAQEAKTRFAHMDGDHLTLLNVFHAYKQQIQDGHDPQRFCNENFISIRAMRQAELARDSLKLIMESMGLPMVSTDFQDKEYYPNIRRCLVSGFFMQAACLENEKRWAYSMLPEGQEVTLHPSSSLGHRPEWLVFHELSLSSKLFMKTSTQIKPEWLLDLSPKGYFEKIAESSSAKAKLEKLLTRRFSQDVA